MLRKQVTPTFCRKKNSLRVVYSTYVTFFLNSISQASTVARSVFGCVYNWEAYIIGEM